MTEKKINITMDNVGDTATLIIREGSAAKIFEPQRVSLCGTINSPAKYCEIHTDLDKKKAIIKFSYDGLFIVLDCDPSDELAPKINGKMEINSDLNKFCINDDEMFSISELLKLLKMNRIYFAQRDTLAPLVTNLSKFKVKVDTEIQKEESDNRGNKKDSVEVKVTSDIPLAFTLKMPLYKGAEESTFKVDICFDVRDAALELWLESVELAELLKEQAKSAIDDQLKKFDRFVCIQS